MIGAALPRRDTAHLVRGAGTFATDITLPALAHAVVVRSTQAHARLRHIDTGAARHAPGVLAVISFADIAAMAQPLPQPLPHPALQSRTPYPLARDVVRYVGEPVAVVVAERRDLAEDAAAQLAIDYAPLAAAADIEAAMAPGAPRVHDDLPDNVAARFSQEVGEVEAALAEAAVVVRERLVIGRATAQPLEPRAITAHHHPPQSEHDLTVWWSTQGPHGARNMLAGQLGMDPTRIRVIAPEIGGGFGVKNRYYPEDTLVPWLAMQLDRPVQYVEDRRESFTATYQARAQIHDVVLGVAADGTILALYDHLLHDQGAYTPLGLVVPYITAVSLPGPYRVPNYGFDCTVVLTHLPPTGPYRGAGKPQANFVLERMLDRAAAQLGMDPVELRRRNLLQPADFPYDTGLIDLDGSHVVLDAGEPERCLTRTLDLLAETPARPAWPPNSEATGIGTACYLEMTGRGPFEGARVTVTSDGRVRVYCGFSSQGQGHRTTLAQICATTLGVPIEAVDVQLGDSSFLDKSIGTYASRVAVMGGNAVALAATTVREQAYRAAAAQLDVDVAELALVEGHIVVKTAPEHNIALGELAVALDATHYYASNQPVYAFGAYAVEVAVDRETGVVQVLRHALCHDCGVAINPDVVIDQIRGGVAQGLGGALWEEMGYDAQGQPQTTSYREFRMPTAADVPTVAVDLANTPTPFNRLGVKGVGEAGVIPVAAAVCAAIEQALGPAVQIRRVPVMPWALCAFDDVDGGRIQSNGRQPSPRNSYNDGTGRKLP